VARFLARTAEASPLSSQLAALREQLPQVSLRVPARPWGFRIGLGEQQVKNYLRGIYREIRVANRTQLVIWLNEQRQRAG